MDCVNQKPVPVIDLTANEDIDYGSTLNRSRSLIELNVTPPLDINGNEILITTDTKTMQAIVYKKKTPNGEPNDQPSLKQFTKTDPELMSPTSSIPSNMYAQQMHWAMLQHANGIQTSFPTAPKEQAPFENKYIRWLRYLRSYNGFRLFAHRYYRKAQAYSHAHIDLSTLSASKTRLFIESILLKWWNSLNDIEKNQYVQIAEIKKSHTVKQETQLKQ